MPAKQYNVRATACDHRQDYKRVYERLKCVTETLTESWVRIEKARKIVIKYNMMKPKDNIVRFRGRRQELVDDDILRRILTNKDIGSNREIYWGDVCVYTNHNFTIEELDSE